MSLPKTSVAAIFESPCKPFVLREIRVPDMEQGHLLVEISLCTICGSDLHTFDGRRKSPAPSILGHEMVGRLVWPQSVTDGAGNLIRAGERLIWSLAVTCGKCIFCNSGLPQKCEFLRKYGHHAISQAWPLNGGLAEHCILLPGTFFLKAPERIIDALAAPASCSTATVAAAVKAAGNIAGKTVLIMGSGMLGQTACAMVDAAGAKAVIAADANLDRAKRAFAFGAKEALDASLPENEFVHLVRERTGGYGVDIAFDFAGANEAVKRAIGSLRPAGISLLVGSVYPQPPLPVEFEIIVRRMLSLRGVYNYRPADLIQALEFLSTSGERYPFAQLVGQEFSLPEVDDAFELARTGSAPFRVGVRPQVKEFRA